MAQQEKGFDADAFYKALATTVAAKGVTWKKVSQDTGVSATTLTRMAQGRRPDSSSLAILASWAGLDIANYVNTNRIAVEPEPLVMATHYLRSDPHLNDAAKDALEAMLTAAYVQFRRSSDK